MNQMASKGASLHDRYYHERVKMAREDTKRTVDVVIPVIRELLRRINDLDPRFSAQLKPHGSYFQNLKVEKADEFDIGVELVDLGIVTCDQESTRNYNLNSPCTDDSVRPDVHMVDTRNPLPKPEVGEAFVQSTLPSKKTWKKDGENGNFPGDFETWDLHYDGDLIPFLVRRRLKVLLDHVVWYKLPRAGKASVNRVSTGPAITLVLESLAIPYKVSVDFVAVITDPVQIIKTNGEPIQVRDIPWVDYAKNQEIKSAGVALVAKYNLYWSLKYGFADHALLDRIDAGGGCRKKVLRIVKMLKNDFFCKTTKPVLNSYMIKTVLFWECEKLKKQPDAWYQNQLENRVTGLVKRLLGYLEAGCVPMYFDDKVNLLARKQSQADKNALASEIRNIKQYLKNPQEFL